MSLDVYLSGELTEKPCTCDSCGHEHTRQVCENFYSSNITHNLNTMADAAGIYKHLWRPEELGITKANELIEPLREGLAKLRANPEHYKQFNAKNGWGLYEHFVPWVQKYLDACEANPEATVTVSR